MKTITWCLVLLMVLASSGQPASAFGKMGHQLTAALAMHFLSVKAKQHVLQLLGSTTPEQAGTWMDEMREENGYEQMADWHFVNAPKGQDYKPGGNDMYRTLDSVTRVLKAGSKYSRAQQKMSMMIMFHLIGDMHQPLHCGYKSDLGGNKVLVQVGNGVLKLHEVWDASIIWGQKITLASCLARYTKTGNAETYKAESKAGVSYLRWIADSRSFLPAVYAFSGGVITPEYIKLNKDLVERRLLKAGMRLALVLESIYG